MTTTQTHMTEITQKSEFVYGHYYDLFYEHYQHCRMMLELMEGKTPKWVITHLAAFDLTTRYYTETPAWKKRDPSLKYLLNTDTEYSPQLLSEISASKRANSDA